MDAEYQAGFMAGKNFALANRFFDPKINGYNIKGCETWGARFNQSIPRGNLWNCGFGEGIKAGLH